MDNKLANAGPLGLMGFGMTTVLLNIHNAGFFPLSAVVLAMGIFYGGIAQIIAGIMEYKKGNTFGTTAFTSYGLFWLSLVAIGSSPARIRPPAARRRPPTWAVTCSCGGCSRSSCGSGRSARTGWSDSSSCH